MKSTEVASYLSEHLGGITAGEAQFIEAMQLLHNYFLVEHTQEPGNFAIHPVVHRWTFNRLEKEQQAVFKRLAVLVAGHAAIEPSMKMNVRG